MEIKTFFVPYLKLMVKEKFGGFNFLILIVTSMSIVKPWIITAWERHFYDQSRKWTKEPLRQFHMQKKSSRICLCLVFFLCYRKASVLPFINCINELHCTYVLISHKAVHSILMIKLISKTCKMSVNVKPVNSEPSPTPSVIKGKNTIDFTKSV